jgi:methionyl-tRNA synthetase
MNGNARKFYITTPIYYVNDIPHIGHVYTTTAADILARYNRMKGLPVFFLTGTDEHGQKVEKAAIERGRTPKVHCDIMVDNFRNLWKRLDISNNAFIRTTDTEHVKTVQGLLQRLLDMGLIEKRSYSGWYCVPDERFWTEKDLVEGNCPDCCRQVEQILEENYFFLMSQYQDKLIDYIEGHPGYILPETRKNEVLGFLKNNALGDLCISRPKSRLSWGIPLPFDPDFVTYVWFDALLNYFSATRYLVPDADRARLGDFWWPATHHLVGKDILTTHAVYWSSMLMALGMPLPENIFAHGWWTVDGKKMSKSVGNVVDPDEMIDKYGADAFRFFLFREVPFGHDGDFSEDALIRRINTDLANDFGNLAGRVLTMLDKYFEGRVPEPDGVEEDFKSLADGIKIHMDEAMGAVDFHKALEHIWGLVSCANKYIDSSAPWVLAKKPETQGRLRTVMYSSAEALRFLAVCLCPFMPDRTQALWEQLGLEGAVSDARLDSALVWGGLQPGLATRRGESLFPRIERPGAELKAETHKKKERKEEKLKMTEQGIVDVIGIEDFARVQLKVGLVLEAERVPKSDKLIRMKVDTGEERQIVAGIGKVYEPEYLIGRKIVVVANLKPAKLMGVESHGMLLAATDDEGNLSILGLDRDVKHGARVK